MKSRERFTQDVITINPRMSIYRNKLKYLSEVKVVLTYSREIEDTKNLLEAIVDITINANNSNIAFYTMLSAIQLQDPFKVTGYVYK